MSLTPPPLFSKASNEAPRKEGHIEAGVWPLRTRLVKDVRAVRRSWPPMFADGPIKSLRCWGLKPHGPPAEPLGKDLIADRTASPVTAIGSVVGLGVEEELIEGERVDAILGGRRRWQDSYQQPTPPSR